MKRIVWHTPVTCLRLPRSMLGLFSPKDLRSHLAARRLSQVPRGVCVWGGRRCYHLPQRKAGGRPTAGNCVLFGRHTSSPPVTHTGFTKVSAGSQDFPSPLGESKQAVDSAVDPLLWPSPSVRVLPHGILCPLPRARCDWTVLGLGTNSKQAPKGSLPIALGWVLPRPHFCLRVPHLKVLTPSWSCRSKAKSASAPAEDLRAGNSSLRGSNALFWHP